MAAMAAVKRFPTVTVRFQKLMMVPFICRGACVYANSRPVVETSTSPMVSST